MNILITGGNGYIAKSLHAELKFDHNITMLTRANFDLTNSRFVNYYFSRNYFDVVIHTAVTGGSRLGVDDVNVLDKNLQMYYNLLANRSSYKKFIHFGSGAQFRSEPGPYGVSKSIIATSMLEKENFYNIVIYGLFDENELDTRFIKASLKKYINKEPILIHADKKMTFFYMKDLAKLINHIIIESPSKLMKTQYASYINQYSLRDVAEYINTLGDYKVPILVGTDVGEDYVSNFNAPYGLDYIGLKEGIIRTYNKLKNE